MDRVTNIEIEAGRWENKGFPKVGIGLHRTLKLAAEASWV
jgi:hypothetical protein